MKILLGPAGSPTGNTLTSLAFVKEQCLQAMELAFTHGVHMSRETAEKIAGENKKHKISMSIHAPYYVNLVSEDEKKVSDSKKRILKSCELGHILGARKIIFHPAYYGRLPKELVYERVKKEVVEMLDTIKENKWNVNLFPETTGRVAQFGTLDELLQMADETGCDICVDPAHIFARNNGKIDFSDMMREIEKYGRKELHFHFSGINFSEKGERNHLTIDSKKPNFAEFAKALLERAENIDTATIICESPVTWKDSLVMKKALGKLGYKF